MNRITVKIDGMHCSECEAHVNALFRKSLDRAIVIASSHFRNQTVILSDREMSDYEIRFALSGSGYRVLGIEHENGLKDSFSFKFHRRFYHFDDR